MLAISVEDNSDNNCCAARDRRSGRVGDRRRALTRRAWPPLPRRRPCGRATSTPSAAPRAWPPTARSARCTSVTTGRCTGSPASPTAAKPTSACRCPAATPTRPRRRVLRGDRVHHHPAVRPEPGAQRPRHRADRRQRLGGRRRDRQRAAGRGRRPPRLRPVRPGRRRLPQRRDPRGANRRPAAGRVHGDKRAPYRPGVLLRLRQRGDVQHRHGQRAHGRHLLRQPVLVRFLLGDGPVGRGGHGERVVRRR